MLNFIFSFILLNCFLAWCSYAAKEILKKEYSDAIISAILAFVTLRISIFLFDWYKLIEFAVKVVEG